MITKATLAKQQTEFRLVSSWDDPTLLGIVEKIGPGKWRGKIGEKNKGEWTILERTQKKAMFKIQEGLKNERKNSGSNRRK